MDELLQKLLSHNSKLEKEAIQELREKGELKKGLDFLLQVLKEKDTNDSHFAANSALMEFGHDAIPILVEVIKDHNTEASARTGAVNVLYLIEAPNAPEILMFALKDPDPEVRGEAAYGLGELKAKEAFEPLLEAIHDPDPYVRKPSMFALGQIGDPRAIEYLETGLHDSDVDVRVEAAAALGQIGGDALDKVLTDLKSTDAETRSIAAKGLRFTKDTRATKHLLLALDDRDPSVQYRVIKALAEISKDHPQPLIAFLQNKEKTPESRARAIKALALTSPKDSTPFILSLEDENPNVRATAASGMPRIRTRQAAEALVKALSDLDPSVREAASENFRSARYSELIPQSVLLTLLKDNNSMIRLNAAAILRSRNVEESALPILLSSLEDADQYVRSIVIQILGNMKDVRAVEPLIIALNDTERNVQESAVRSLEAIGTSEALEAVKNWKVKQENSSQ